MDPPRSPAGPAVMGVPGEGLQDGRPHHNRPCPGPPTCWDARCTQLTAFAGIRDTPSPPTWPLSHTNLCSRDLGATSTVLGPRPPSSRDKEVDGIAGGRGPGSQALSPPSESGSSPGPGDPRGSCEDQSWWCHLACSSVSPSLSHRRESASQGV